MHSPTVTFLVLFCVVSFVEVLGDAQLTCYQCTNLKLKDSNPVLNQLLSGQTDQWCEYPSLGDATETCPSSIDHMCGYFEGSVSFSVPFFKDTKVTVQKRGCVKVESNTGINQCRPIGTDSEKKFIEVILSVLTVFSNLKVDGTICVCGTDLCDAHCNGFAVGPICLSTPIFVLICIVASVLGLLIVTCCCCCCCCTCCKSRRPAFVAVGLPYVTVTSLPQTSIGIQALPPYSSLQDDDEPAVK